MLVRLRQGYASLVTSATQLVLVGFAVGNGTRIGMWAGGGLLAILSFLTWMSAVRRQRAIDDTPTSHIASAAQGYVELVGRGVPLGGLPVLSPLTGLPCLWYRYRVERRQDSKWIPDGSGESDASFIIDDGTGQCVVDPEGAEMLVARRDTWTRADRRYTQWLLVRNDAIYALGEFITKGSVDIDHNRDEDVKALLAEWKQDRQRLMERFDLDKNGELDMREWELARRQAKREIARAHRESTTHAELHLMRMPENRGLYLISSLPPTRLARRYRLWSWVHLAFFFLGLAGLGYGTTIL
jgi:hypothetical protein